jgi:hypothetical protein
MPGADVGDPDAQDLCDVCLSDDLRMHCDGSVAWCSCSCGWPSYAGGFSYDRYWPRVVLVTATTDDGEPVL